MACKGRIARVLTVHAGDGGDPQLFCQHAEIGTGVAVTAGVKGRSGDHEVWFLATQKSAERLGGAFLFIDEIVVAADDGGLHHAVLPECCLQRPAGANRAATNLRGSIGFVLSADTAEELVQVVDNPYWFCHGILPIQAPRESDFAADTRSNSSCARARLVKTRTALRRYSLALPHS